MRALLRKHPGLRRLLRWPLRWREWYLARLPNAIAARYRSSVHGGVLVLKPANLPADYEVPATSDLAVRILATGVYEPEISHRLRGESPRSGALFNIGANVGFWAVAVPLWHDQITAVVAFEPHPVAASHLRINCRKHLGNRDVQVHEAAVGDRPGTIELHATLGRPEYSSVGGVLHESVADVPRETIAVPLVRLDDLAASLPASSLWVMDVEGSEQRVIAGARAILRRDRPWILLECSASLLRPHGDSPGSLVRELEALDYRVQDLLTGSTHIPETFDGNLIATPATA